MAFTFGGRLVDYLFEYDAKYNHLYFYDLNSSSGTQTITIDLSIYDRLSFDDITFNGLRYYVDTSTLLNSTLGTAGQDSWTISGASGFWDGGAGSDTFSVSFSNEGSVLFGGAGNDYFYLSTNSDFSTGGTFYVSGGDDVDTADFSNLSIGGEINLAIGSYFLTDGNGAGAAGVLVEIENIVGTGGSDTITGDSENNIIDGGLGDDTLRGGEGDDTIDGGEGDDRVTYSGNYTDYSFAASTDENGNAVLLVTDTAGDTDTLSNIEYLKFDDRTISVTLANSRGTTVTGATGIDILVGGAGIDTLDYSTTDTGVTVDLYNEWATNGVRDVVFNIENLVLTEFDDSATGTQGDNVIDLGAGDDFVKGAAGDDTITGGAGDDTIFGDWGGGGNSNTDTAVYNGNFADFSFDAVLYSGNRNSLILTDNNASDGLDEGTDKLTDVGMLQFADLSLKTVAGSENDDTLSGSEENELLVGGRGNDTIDGGEGDDRVTYSGNYTDYSFAASTDENGNAVLLVTDTAGDTDTLSNIEYLKFDDQTISVELAGDSGDTMAGTDGIDILAGGAGIDTLDYSAADNGVTVDLYNEWATNGARDVVFNIENLVLTEFDDSATGTQGDNVIDLGAGDDFVKGAAGDDTITGGAGDDTIFGDWGGGGYSNTDTAVYNGNFADFSFDAVLYSGNRNSLILTDNNASDGLDEGTDKLTDVGMLQFADLSLKTVVGSENDDTLSGSEENELLVGGRGNDTFQFVKGVTGHDRIADFSAGTGSDDVLEFDSTVFANIATLLSVASDNGIDTTISIDSGTSIILQNVTVAALHEDDFIFV